METNTQTINVFDLPVLEVLSDHELQLAIERWQRRYAEASAHVAAAYDMHNEAIDDNEPYEIREQLWQMCIAVEAVQQDAYRKLDAAKAMLLARRN